MNKRTGLAAWIVPSCVLIVVVAADRAAAFGQGTVSARKATVRPAMSLAMDGQSSVVASKPAVPSYGATLATKMPVGAVVVPAVEGALAKAIGSHGTDTIFHLKSGVLPYARSAPRYVVNLRNLVIRKYSFADQECAVSWPRREPQICPRSTIATTCNP